MSGVWRLEFNHGLVQSIVHANITLSELIGIVGEAGIYAPVAIIASAVFALGGWLLGKADLGNGILIRFFAGNVPTKITNSTHNWN